MHRARRGSPTRCAMRRLATNCARAAAPDLRHSPALGRRRAGSARRRAQAARLRRLRHRGRRRLPDRLHLGHHRRAEGHHAFPPRRAGDLRCAMPREVLRAAAGRHLHRHAAAGLHLRARRAACCSRCASAPRRCCSRRPRPDDLLRGDRSGIGPRSASPRRPPTARWRPMRARARPAARCASASRPARRCRSRRRKPGRRATGIADHRRHRRDRDAAHLHLGARGATIRPGATGMPVPGYEATVVDDDGSRGAARHGRPARRARADRLPLPRRPAPGATTCSDGWNVTGDAYMQDEDGYFWFQARTDDMIISAGYNIAGPEVEEALLTPSGGRRVRRGRRARRGARADREGVRRAASRHQPATRAGARCRTT